MVEWVSARWELQPEIAVEVSKYGSEHNIVGLERVGIKAYLPIPNPGIRRGFYATEIFQYDAEEDRYICPQGQFLPLHSRRKSEDKYIYRANAKICNAFPVKAECTNSKSGRHIFRSFYHEYLEKVRGYHQAPEYQRTMRERSHWVEPLFGEAKDFHRLRCFRLRGLMKVNIEGVIIAAGQNLKKLLKHKLEWFL